MLTSNEPLSLRPSCPQSPFPPSMSVSQAGGAVVALLPPSTLLALYRTTLRHAAVFPSSKRKGIIRDIRLDWRSGKHLDREKQREECHRAQTKAVDGLKMLKQYVNLNTMNSGTWSLSLGNK